MVTDEELQKGFWGRTSTRILVGIVGCLTLLLFLLPLGAKYYAQKWLKDNGADSAVIKSLRFNPFTGRLVLEGVKIASEGQPMLESSDLVIDLDYRSLFDKNIHLDEGLYRDLLIKVEQLPKGHWRIGSYTAITGEKRREVVVESGEDTPSAWAFLADHLRLQNCELHLKTPQYEMNLVVEKAEINRISTRAGDPAGNLSLVGSLNGESVALELETLQLIPHVRVLGEVKIGNFLLEDLSLLLAEILPDFSGGLGLAGSLDLSLEEGVAIIYDGGIDLKKPSLGNKSFSTRATELGWKGKISYSSSASSPWTVEADGLLEGDAYYLSLGASGLTTSEDHLSISGTARVRGGDSLVVTTHAGLKLEGIALSLSTRSFTQEKLAWKGQVDYDSDREGQGNYVAVEGSLELSPFYYQGEMGEAEMRAGFAGLGWDGKIVYGGENSGQPGLHLAGSLAGAELYGEGRALGGKIVQQKLALDLDTEILFAKELSLRGKNHGSLDGFAYYQGQTEDGLQADSSVPLFSLANLELMDFATEMGRFTLEKAKALGAEVSLAGGFPVTISLPELHLEKIDGGDSSLVAIDRLSLLNPRMFSLAAEKEVARLGDLVIADLHLNKDLGLSASTLSLSDFSFLGDDQGAGPLAFTNAKLASLHWSKESGTDIGELRFDTLTAELIRDKEGKLNLATELRAMLGEDEAAEDEAAAKPQPEADQEMVTAKKTSRKLPLRLERLMVSGQSWLRFRDETLAVAYHTDLAVKEFSVEGLDGQDPEQKLSYGLTGTLEGRAPLVVSGDMAPFAARPAMEMDLLLKNYPLESLSPYTVQSVGTALSRGQLRLTTRLSLKDDYLNMDNQVMLKKLKTKKISATLAKELDNQLPIPLDTALSMLRDSNKNIDLEIPIKGPVSDLNVGIADVLTTALGKALVPAASGYMLYTLGPYGALAYVGVKAGEKIMQVRFPPVDFAPGQTELLFEKEDYLKRIGKILKNRPETDIQLCPRVVSWEFMSKKEIDAIASPQVPIPEKQEERLMELGQKRGEMVQSYLVEKYDVKPGRLLICEPVIVLQKSATPAVLPQL